MDAEYLITGGAGFIGSNVAEHLVRQGKAVRVLDNFLTGKRENLASVRRADAPSATAQDNGKRSACPTMLRRRATFQTRSS